MKTYEAMFLVDAGDPDFDQTVEPVRNILNRIQAEVLSLKPWDDRRIAYEIKGRRRALYVLTYFKADPGRIAEAEHEVQINEKIIRMLVLNGDHLTAEQIQAETPATLALARSERRREETSSAESEAPDRKVPPEAAEEEKEGPAGKENEEPRATEN